MTDVATSKGVGVALSHPLDRLERQIERMTRPVASIGVMGMLLVAGATVADVLLRWSGIASLAGLNELTAMTFAVAVSACLPSGLARSVHLTVDVVDPMLTPRIAGWLKAMGALLLLVIYAILTWRLMLHAIELDRDNTQSIYLELRKAPYIYAASAFFMIGVVVQSVSAANAIRKAAEIRSSWIRKDGDLSTVSLMSGFVVVSFACVIVLAVVDHRAVAEWASANQDTVALLAFAVMWISLLLMVPLAAVLAIVGLIGMSTVIGGAPSFSAFGTEAAGVLTNYHIATLPLFLMMGSFAVVAGVAGDLYRLAQAVLGSLRGGLALATIAGCAGFGTVSGSSLSTIATFGRISLPEMRARGYAPFLATGSVAAGGNLGALIPPSGPLILFALLSETSIGQLFVAAVMPGLMAYALYSLAVVATTRIAPKSIPPAVKTKPGELKAAVRSAMPSLALFGVVMGGIYLGIFTATEAAAFGAFFAFVLAMLRGRLIGGSFWKVMAETTATTALIYTLFFGALSFSFFIGVTSLPDQLTAFLEHLELAPIAVIAIVLAIFIALGCVMDAFTILVITVPIMTPVITGLGYDVIWWGIINLAVVELGTITPPFGVHVFVLKAFAPDVSVATVFKGVLPFCAADVIKLALLVLFPAIVLWLPTTMSH